MHTSQRTEEILLESAITILSEKGGGFRIKLPAGYVFDFKGTHEIDFKLFSEVKEAIINCHGCRCDDCMDEYNAKSKT